MPKTVFAVAAHPDDIEFMMAGTLFLLNQLGCDIHYMNIANGDCGTASLDRREIADIRKLESQNAAQMLEDYLKNQTVKVMGKVINFENKKESTVNG